jgi:hypothetical protein
MAEFAGGSTGRSSNCSSRTTSKAPAWLPVILAGTALALTACNANQEVNPSEQANLRAVYYNYNAYDPTSYGQTSGTYHDPGHDPDPAHFAK